MNQNKSSSKESVLKPLFAKEPSAPVLNAKGDDAPQTSNPATFESLSSITEIVNFLYRTGKLPEIVKNADDRALIVTKAEILTDEEKIVRLNRELMGFILRMKEIPDISRGSDAWHEIGNKLVLIAKYYKSDKFANFITEEKLRITLESEAQLKSMENNVTEKLASMRADDGGYAAWLEKTRLSREKRESEAAKEASINPNVQL